jgi:hypothetical protein
MTWVYFTVHAAMAVKVWFGKLRVSQRLPMLRDAKGFPETDRNDVALRKFSVQARVG